MDEKRLAEIKEFLRDVDSLYRYETYWGRNIYFNKVKDMASQMLEEIKTLRREAEDCRNNYVPFDNDPWGQSM